MTSQVVALARLTAFIVGMLKVVVRAVIIGAKVKTSRMSSNANFMFNFSPPLFHFSSRLMIYGAGNTKPIWSYLLEDCSVVDVESELLTQMNERIVKNFLDMLILIELKRGSLSYNELASIFQKRFGEIVDSSLVDSNLNFLEKEGLIMSGKAKSSKAYALTMKGEEKVRAFLNSKDKILGLLLNLFL